jgi:hypothetical protein
MLTTPVSIDDRFLSPDGGLRPPTEKPQEVPVSKSVPGSTPFSTGLKATEGA